jgi:hypothetical protein
MVQSADSSTSLQRRRSQRATGSACLRAARASFRRCARARPAWTPPRPIHEVVRSGGCCMRTGHSRMRRRDPLEAPIGKYLDGKDDIADDAYACGVRDLPQPTVRELKTFMRDRLQPRPLSASTSLTRVRTRSRRRSSAPVLATSLTRRHLRGRPRPRHLGHGTTVDPDPSGRARLPDPPHQPVGRERQLGTRSRSPEPHSHRSTGDPGEMPESVEALHLPIVGRTSSRVTWNRRTRSFGLRSALT